MATVRTSKTVSMKDSPNKFVGYSNIIGVNISAEEATLIFGLREEGNPEEATIIAKLYVSPSHAKRLAATLAKTVERYEDMFGVLIVDPEERLIPEFRAKIEAQLRAQDKGEKA
jgi:hypothetical protein